MDLQKFITETLNQIIDGVANAQETAKQKGAYINGVVNYAPGVLPLPSEIEFDIAVATTESQNIQGGIGIFVADAGIGYKANKENAGNAISRIKFTISVILPAQDMPEEEVLIVNE